MPYDQSQSQQLAAAIGAFALVGGIIGLVALVFGIIIYWKIFSKAGYNGALSLLMLIPIANIIMLCILAFGNWPILQELNQLRQQVMARPGYPQSSPFPPNNPQFR